MVSHEHIKRMGDFSGIMRVLVVLAVLIPAFLMVAPAWAEPFEVSGGVISYTREPVEGASVWLVQDRQVDRVETDAEGSFRFNGVTVGPASVVALKEGYALGGADIRVSDSVEVDVMLAPADDLTVRVTNPQHRPVSGAYVKSLRIGGEFTVSVEELMEEGFPRLRSDDEGFLTIPHLPQQSHIACRLYHRDYAESHVAYLPVGRIEDQDILLYPGVTLEGRVTGPDQEGVSGARIKLFRVGGGGRREFASEFTDPEGFYRMNARPGEYYLTADHPTFGAPKPVEVALRPGDEEGARNIELQSPRYIEGAVVDPDGEPMAGVDVAFLGEEGTMHTHTWTAANGEYELQVGLEQGAVRVFPPSGYITDAFSDVLVQFDGAERINLDPLELDPLPEIRGQVVDAQGEPQPHVILSTRDLEQPLWFLTDEEGQFSIRLPRVPDDAEATFEAEHALRFQRGEFTVDLRDPAPIQLELEPFEPRLRERDEERPDGNRLSRIIGEDAPPVRADEWWNSDPLDTQEMRGTVLVLLFWGGFDHLGEGRNVLEHVRALHALYEDVDDVEIIGVHDSSLEADDVEYYVDEYGIQFPVARDVDTAETFHRFNITYIPEVVLIDRRGRVRFHDVEHQLSELIKVLRREGR
ncbi:MAG: carboxypeptidase regulatory-like domain-containing protein [Candidatus Hydrogenedentota bacterium]